MAKGSRLTVLFQVLEASRLWYNYRTLAGHEPDDAFVDEFLDKFPGLCSLLVHGKSVPEFESTVREGCLMIEGQGNGWVQP